MKGLGQPIGVALGVEVAHQIPQRALQGCQPAVHACPSAIQQWLVAALSDPSFSSGAVEPKGATMAAFAQLLVRQSALSTGDFTSVCRSLADICRGKLAPDSLNRFLQAAG